MDRLWNIRVTAVIRRGDGKENIISHEGAAVARSAAEALQATLIEFRAEVNAVGMTFLYVETFDYEQLDERGK